MHTSELLQRRIAILGKNAPLFYEQPLHLVRGDGVWLYGADGRKYLDAYNNVAHVGHSHPRVVDAIAAQARLLNTSTRYLHENVVAYAERLKATFGGADMMVMFCCSGSEANELALRIVRECSGGMGVISTAHAYHGNTAAVSQVSSILSAPEKRGPHVRNIPVIDPYRERGTRSDAELADRYCGDVATAIDGLKASGAGFAGMILCTGLSSEGLPTQPAGYMARVAEQVRAAGGYFIADEVQGGFGRFGSHFWGHQVQGAVPDIVTLGKPMGNGHPLAAVIARRELVEQFTELNPMYFNTFAGNPVSCAAGMAVLDILEEEGLVANADSVGRYVLDQLNDLATRHELIGDVRGKGLFFAVELVTDRATRAPAANAAKAIINAMSREGVLISRIGPNDNILKIRPPMPFQRAHADQLLETLDRVLSETVVAA
jgi:4-aminobutyrate aminotransferase-like enzyme